MLHHIDINRTARVAVPNPILGLGLPEMILWVAIEAEKCFNSLLLHLKNVNTYISYKLPVIASTKMAPLMTLSVVIMKRTQSDLTLA
jgi:hypothetical protein